MDIYVKSLAYNSHTNKYKLKQFRISNKFYFSKVNNDTLYMFIEICNKISSSDGFITYDILAISRFTENVNWAKHDNIVDESEISKWDHYENNMNVEYCKFMGIGLEHQINDV